MDCSVDVAAGAGVLVLCVDGNQRVQCPVSREIAFRHGELSSAKEPAANRPGQSDPAHNGLNPPPRSWARGFVRTGKRCGVVECIRVYARRPK